MRNQNKAACCHSNGFTLIELLITLTIATIVTVAAMPSLHTMMAKQRISSQAYELVASINLTRSEAIKRGHTVTLCKSTDGQQCEKNIGWNSGWLIFADNNGNKKRDAAEKIIRIYNEVSDRIQITNGRNNVAYTPSGRLSSQSGSFRVSDSSKEIKTRRIVISRSGRVRTEYENAPR